MKRLILATVAVFVLGTTGALGGKEEGADAAKAVAAAEPKKEKGRETAKLRGELADLSRICKLSEEQKKKLLDIDEAREKAMKELKAMSVGQIAGVLTPEQKVMWNDTMLMALVQREFGKASLTDEQKTRIKAEISAQTADVLFALNEKTPQIVKGLMLFIKDKVLTEDQKTAMKESRRQSKDAAKPGEGDAKKTEKKPEGQ